MRNGISNLFTVFVYALKSVSRRIIHYDFATKVVLIINNSPILEISNNVFAVFVLVLITTAVAYVIRFLSKGFGRTVGRHGVYEIKLTTVNPHGGKGIIGKHGHFVTAGPSDGARLYHPMREGRVLVFRSKLTLGQGVNRAFLYLHRLHFSTTLAGKEAYRSHNDRVFPHSSNSKIFSDNNRISGLFRACTTNTPFIKRFTLGRSKFTLGRHVVSTNLNRLHSSATAVRIKSNGISNRIAYDILNHNLSAVFIHFSRISVNGSNDFAITAKLEALFCYYVYRELVRMSCDELAVRPLTCRQVIPRQSCYFIVSVCRNGQYACVRHNIAANNKLRHSGNFNVFNL